MSISHQNHVYISPSDCGSGVGYYITTSDYTDKNDKTTYSLNATVVLSDCTHKIDWRFGSDEVDKIDEAISMLQEFRRKYLTTKKEIDRLNK